MPLLDTDSAPPQDNQNQDKPKDQKVETPGWLAGIEDKNLQENDTLRRFRDPHALAVSYVELRNKLGTNPVSVPDDKAPPEKWDEFYNRLGRPDKPEKYELTKLEGMEREADMENSFRLQAHALGLSQKQADGLNRWVGELAKNKMDTDLKAHNAMVEEAEATLKKEWGNDYAKNLAIANKALHRFGGKELGERLKAKGLDGDPVLVRFFATLGKSTMEESELKGLGTGRQPGVKSRAQLEEMMKDKRYWTDTEFRRVVENGFAALYGEQQQQ